MKTKFLYCIGFIILFGMTNQFSRAQTTITGGSYVIVGTGAILTATQNMNVSDGGNLLVNGILTLKKDLLNQNAAQDDLGPGTVRFYGYPGIQNISGMNLFQDLTLDNADGLVLAGDVRVNGVLTLTDGRITLGSYYLAMGPGASVAGSLSYKRMVVATGSGDLRKEFSGPGSFTYPIGDADGTIEYSPVTITFNSGTFPAGNYIGIRLRNEKYNDPNITGNYLNRYWMIKQTQFGTPVFDAVFQYLAADVTGNEAALSCTRVNNQTWTTWSPANTALHRLSGSAISGVGTFTGVKSTTAPEFQQLQNIAVGNGDTRCYDATQILYVAGNGNTFTVAGGGSVTLVAGVKISMLPGTTVNQGGYLHGYISTNGIYCGTSMSPMVASPGNDDPIMSVAPLSKDRMIRIYPNPTHDRFTVEILRNGITTDIHLEIFSLDGQHVASGVISGQTHQQFTLEGMPPGLYIVHATTDGSSEISKIVKY